MLSKKKLVTILSLLIILLFFAFSWKTAGSKDNFLAQKIKSLIPENLKKSLKNTIFATPYIIEKNKKQDERIKKLTQRIAILEGQVFNLENQGSLKTISNEEISVFFSSFNFSTVIFSASQSVTKLEASRIFLSASKIPGLTSLPILYLKVFIIKSTLHQLNLKYL